MASKKEILEKIEKLIELEGDELERAAERIAPDFDYEKEGKALQQEEAAKPLPAAEVSPSRYPKPKYQAKTSLGKVFLKDKNTMVLGAVLIMLVAVLGWWTYDYVIPLCQGEKATAIIGGVETEIVMIPGTVEENLEFNKIDFDSNDEIRPALDAEIDEDTQIVVKLVEYKEVEKKEEVKATSVVMLDPELDSGVQKKTPGNDGEGIYVYKTKIVDGVEVKTKKKLKRWITEPHDETLHLGTKRTGHEGKYKITSTFTANCSAYWMGNNCIGASGGRCVYGTVAVDRHKYPYGTKFWIEGYGFAVANDCGTSIKGDKLDLWMDSFAESCRWGRRHMQTYVLEEIK